LNDEKKIDENHHFSQNLLEIFDILFHEKMKKFFQKRFLFFVDEAKTLFLVRALCLDEKTLEKS
jgi:hypothetical protein